MPVAARAVQDQHGVVDLPPRVAMRLAQRRVMQAKILQRLARAELEIMDDVVAFLRGGRRGFGGGSRTGETDGGCGDQITHGAGPSEANGSLSLATAFILHKAWNNCHVRA